MFVACMGIAERVAAKFVELDERDRTYIEGVIDGLLADSKPVAVAATHCARAVLALVSG